MKTSFALEELEEAQKILKVFPIKPPQSCSCNGQMEVHLEGAALVAVCQGCRKKQVLNGQRWVMKN